MRRPLLLTPAQVGREISVSRSRVYEMISEGILPSIRFGRSLRVPSDALEAWVADMAAPKPVAESPG